MKSETNRVRKMSKYSKTSRNKIKAHTGDSNKENSSNRRQKLASRTKLVLRYRMEWKKR